jgi:hypothetical protein
MTNVLARCNGAEFVDHDGELWIVQKRSPPHITSAVLAATAFILIVNGVVQAIMIVNGDLWEHAISAGIALGIGAIFVRILIGVRRSAAQYTEEPRPSLIIAGGKLLDRERRELALLAHVRFEKVWQATSSSRALALVWGPHRMIIARGNPFGDSVDGCVHVLRSHGISPT